MVKVKKAKRDNLFTRNYFFLLSLTVLTLGLIAFSDNFYFDTGQESNSNPGFIIHGLIMYAWFVTVVIQTNRIRKLNYAAHKKLGIAGFILAALLIISIGYLFAIGQPYNTLPYYGKANRFFYAAFILLIFLAYLKRDKPEFHKHAIMVGIILLMEPLLSRVGMNTGTNPASVAPLIWLTLWISLFVYDIVRLRRLHFLTYTGLIFWFAVYTAVS